MSTKESMKAAAQRCLTRVRSGRIQPEAVAAELAAAADRDTELERYGQDLYDRAIAHCARSVWEE
jgi:hypothetical protein